MLICFHVELDKALVVVDVASSSTERVDNALRPAPHSGGGFTGVGSQSGAMTGAR